ncbi:type II toxin-antitoxin system RelE/ParE family toxin [Buttiauxella selenatireducens]|uniref:Type II toxin-antitoxin system RelE/ParE family toxin n=1 Tax=Buttiauxella selenatireducens TaxID=3073902 RepID=A0ABY9SGN1_9ENTR|nr:type II toxin-antitoxin system RelE/ParE family toxin [Buttiauxella sp. R73]WMY76645.1 type II toxin-antitoxin system RelE/ParE family toxin [Buttiauxella sp. R73]
MSYELEFKPSALKEWKKLGHTVKAQFKKKLAEVLEAPRIPGSQLHGGKDHYKIKLKSVGYRLVYEVNDKTVTVIVCGIGRRDDDDFYDTTMNRH